MSYWSAQPWHTYWGFHFYTGILPLMLVVLGWVYGERRWRFWTVLGVVGLLLAFGPGAALHKLVHQFVPGFGMLRVPEAAEIAGLDTVKVPAQAYPEGIMASPPASK